MINSPFSVRNLTTSRQIGSDFPTTARNGLLYILIELVDRMYVSGWNSIAKEMQRICRLSPVEYNSHLVKDNARAKTDAENVLSEMHWAKVYDFCERLHSFLAISYESQDINDPTNQTKEEAQLFISSELQRLFLEEQLAFGFENGLVVRKGRKHTVIITTKAQTVLSDLRLQEAKKHFEKSLKFFGSSLSNDFENSVKEAVCSVEAAAKSLFPSAKASTLGGFTNWLSSTKEINIPKALIQTITGIYAYRSGGDGIGHGGSTGGPATAEVAEYVLAVCAAQIIYLLDIANGQESEVPF